nr:hypothetical protein Iba_chr02aCG15830 [Ipomoea batatas]
MKGKKRLENVWDTSLRRRRKQTPKVSGFHVNLFHGSWSALAIMAIVSRLMGEGSELARFRGDLIERQMPDAARSALMRNFALKQGFERRKWSEAGRFATSPAISPAIKLGDIVARDAASKGSLRLMQRPLTGESCRSLKAAGTFALLRSREAGRDR